MAADGVKPQPFDLDEPSLSLGRLGTVQLKNYVALSEAESAAVLQMRNHPRVRMHMVTQETISQQTHAAFLDSLKTQRDTQMHFLVCKEGVILGVVNFRLAQANAMSAQIGMFANPDQSNPLTAFLLEQTLICFGFEVLGLQRLEARVLADNPTVMAMHERFGFQRQGSADASGLVLWVLTRQANQ